MAAFSPARTPGAKDARMEQDILLSGCLHSVSAKKQVLVSYKAAETGIGLREKRDKERSAMIWVGHSKGTWRASMQRVCFFCGVKAEGDEELMYIVYARNRSFSSIKKKPLRKRYTAKHRKNSAKEVSDIIQVISLLVNV